MPLLLLCLSVFWAGPGQAQLDLVSPERFSEADDAFRQRADVENARFAAERYRELYMADSEDAEAAWRYSMAAYFMGEWVAQEKSEKIAFHAAGRDAGRRAVELEPDCAPCHFFTGVNMALYGRSVGIIKMIFTLGDVRRHLRRSLELDPTFAYASAPRLLGLIDQRLPRILGGNKRRAWKYFEQALELAPEEPLSYLYMAEYLDRVDKDLQAALDVVQRGMILPEPPLVALESLEAHRRLPIYAEELRVRIAEPPKPSRLGVRRKNRMR